MSNIGNKETFSKNLKYYLQRSGKSQKELAEIIGVSPSTFNEWLQARKYPRINRIEMLANYFGILKSDLIEEKSKNNIKLLREQRHISLYEMASDLHIESYLLEQYEKGMKKVPIETLEKISEYFNVPVDDIVTLGLITSEKTTLVTSDVRLAKLQERWFKEVGTDPLTDEEMDKLIEYAKFLKSMRKK